MRKLLLAAGILMLGVGAVSANLHAQDAPAKKPEKDNAKDAEATKTSVYKATIAGMSWGVSWVKTVTETVSRLEGVDKVEVDFKSKLATITMKEGATLSEETLKKAFEDSRFSVEKFESNDSDESKKDSDDAVVQAVHTATITGMTWGVTWVKAVTKTVSSLDGVDKVEVDFESKTATITMKDGKTLAKDDLVKAFDGTKFGVDSFETVKKSDGDSREDSKKDEPPKKDDSKEGKKK